MSAPFRLGIVRDYRAEGWPSMDICADQLLAHLPSVAGLSAADIAPPFRSRFQRLPLLGGRKAAFNGDRLFNRFFDLPRFLRRIAGDYDWFHIVDHTYAMAARALPAGRFGVNCHDLDAFQCLLDPVAHPRPWWFRALTRRIRDGLRSAAVVFYESQEIGRHLRETGWVEPHRLVYLPLGVAEEYTPSPPDRVSFPLAMPPDDSYLLHVGNNVPRKRLDVLLEVFARVRALHPGLRLVQVGGPWPTERVRQIGRLGIGANVIQVRGLSRAELAELYRRAAVVLMPSEAEGFGLPVIESLACGAVVVASDIPVLREVGGPAAIFRPVGDVSAWAEAVERVLAEPSFAPPREVRLAHTARFSWAENARTIGETYLRLAADGPADPSL